MTELKPCPFCGCPDIDNKDDGDFEWMECRNCGATGGYDEAFPERSAQDHWNTRADLSPRREAVVDLIDWETKRDIDETIWSMTGGNDVDGSVEIADAVVSIVAKRLSALTPLDTPVGNTDPMTIAKYDDELRAEDDTGSLNNIIALKIREIDELVPDCWKQEGYHYLPVSKPEPTGSSMWVVKTANGRSLIITDGDKETMSAVCPTEQTGNPVAEADIARVRLLAEVRAYLALTAHIDDAKTEKEIAHNVGVDTAIAAIGKFSSLTQGGE